MEQRAFDRLEIDVEASAGNGALGWRGVIRDFCRGGLYFSIRDMAATPEAGLRRPIPGEEIRVEFVTPEGGTQPFGLRTRVVRADRSGVGLSFATPLQSQDPVWRALLHLHGRHLAAAQPAPGGAEVERGRLVDECDARLSEVLWDGFDTFAEAAIQALETAGDKARNNQQQTEFREAIGALRQGRDAVLADWMERLRNALGVLRDGSPPVELPPASLKGVELVDEDHFDEWVMVVSLATHIESDHTRLFYEIGQRAAALVGHPLEREENPLTPTSLLRTLLDALRGQGVSGSSRRLILGQVGEALFPALMPAFEAINQALIEAGLLPDLDGRAEAPAPPQPAGAASPPPSPPVPASDAAEAPGGFTPPPPVWAPSEGLPRRSFGVLQDLAVLRGRGAASLSRPERVAATQALEAQRRRLVEILPDLSLDDARPILAQLQERLQGTPEGRMGDEMKGAINAAEGLVRTMQHDPTVPAQLQRAILGLRGTMSGLALQEPEFLDRPEHPAVRVLNNIGTLSVALSAEPDQSPQAQQIRLLVDRTLERLSRAHDLSADLKEAEQLLEAQAHRVRHLFDVNVRRVVESQRGWERLQRERGRVEQAVGALLGGRDIARFVTEVLEAGWQTLLVNTLLQEGEEGPGWRAYLAVLGSLADWLSPELFWPPAGEAEAGGVLDALEVGFAEAPSNPARQARLVERLRAALLQDAQAFERMVAERTTYQPTAPEPVAPAPPTRRPQEIALELGDWVVENRGGGVSRPLSLAWVDDERDTFVFVDGKGARALQCSRAELLGGLESGKLSILEDGGLPLVERTVSRMLKATYQKLLHNAEHDPITGLPSRRAFTRAIEQALGETRGGRNGHVALYLDLDHFKMINDLCGHEGGDRLLLEMGEVLGAGLSGRGVIARIGNDEYGVLLGEGHEAGFQTAELLRRGVEAHTFVWREHSFAVSLSIGMAELTQFDHSASGVLGFLESACQVAKQSGGNRVKVYESADREVRAFHQSMTSVRTMEEALQQERLQLFVQPIHAIYSGAGPQDHHFEVLLRIIAPDGEFLGPQEFVKAAEEFRRMEQVDRWVVRTIFQWLNAHAERIQGLGGFSINLSGQSLENAEMLDFVVAQVEGSRFPRHKIAFEITETAVVINRSQANAFIRRIRDLGCQFYLDDFGSGQASYAYLKDLPVNCVKIDGIFIRNLADDDRDIAVVKSITEIAHYMKKQVIAEYVESPLVIEQLRRIGVDYVQGYAVAEPMPINRLIAH